MKIKVTIIRTFLPCLLLLVMGGRIQAIDLTVMTYNVRIYTVADGELVWQNRKEAVVKLLQTCAADVIGVQEALLGQVNDIAAYLPGYDWVGVGSDNGLNAGAYAPIFYNSQRFQLKDHGWFWLSETPEFPSLSWGATAPRLCTFAKLEDYDTRRNFWVFNTHLDMDGDEAKEEALRLIHSKIKDLNDDKLPVILTGDFNQTPDEAPMKWLLRRMDDARERSETEPSGPEGTFNGFELNRVPEKRFDYILVNNKVSTVNKYSVVADSFGENSPSDHFPVLVEIWFK